MQFNPDQLAQLSEDRAREALLALCQHPDWNNPASPLFRASALLLEALESLEGRDNQ